MKQKSTIDMILPIRSEIMPESVGPIVIPTIVVTVSISSIQPDVQTKMSIMYYVRLTLPCEQTRLFSVVIVTFISSLEYA